MAACHRALALAPDHLHALRNLSLCLYRTGRFDEGAEVTVRALKPWPDEVMLHYTMREMLYGLVRECKADPARGLAQWRQHTYPTNPTAQHMAASTLSATERQRDGGPTWRDTSDP